MKTLRSACERGVDFGIGALVLFTPLAFGSVETWAIIVLETTIFAIGGLWLASLAMRGRSRRRRAASRPDRERTVGRDDESALTASRDLSVGGPARHRDEDGDEDNEQDEGDRHAGAHGSRPLTGLAVPILLFIGVGLFQLVPLPRAVLSFLSPRTSTLYERTIPDYGRGAGQSFEDWLLAPDAARPGTTGSRAERGSVAVPISYMPSETRKKLLLFSAYAVLFFVAAVRYRDRIRRSRMLVWIVFVGVGIAIQGIFQKLTWNGKILWFRSPGFDPRAFGPFLNSNHFAGYMELIVPIALGLLLMLLWNVSRASGPWAQTEGSRPRAEETGAWVPPGKAARAEISSWIATNPLPKAVLLGFLLALSIGSIILSLSRGGVLATAVTFAIFARSLIPPTLVRRSRRGAVAILVAIFAGVMALTFWIGASSILERAASMVDTGLEASYGGRLETWGHTLEMFRDHAVLGTGLGSYEFSFAGYYPAGTFLSWEEAHNDYVQFLAETGVAGLIPALVVLIVFMRRHYLPAVFDKRRPDRYLLLGLAMAILSMLLHSFVDFNLQVPAVALLFVLIGALLAASNFHKGRDKRTEDAVLSGAWRGRLRVAGAASLFVAAAATAVTGAHNVGASKMAWKLQTSTERPPDLIENVRQLTETRPMVLASFADGALASFDDWWAFGGQPEEKAREELTRAEGAYRELVAVTPLWSWGWWGLGNVYARRSALERSSKPTTVDSLVISSEKDLTRDAQLAAAALRTSLYLEPNSYLILDDLARLYRDEGLYPAALETYRASARIMPLYDRHKLRPADDLPEDVYRAIAEGMEQALVDPGEIDAAVIRQNLGDMASSRGDLSTAEKQFRLGLTAASTGLMRGNHLLELGEALRRQNKLGEAASILERATEYPAAAKSSWAALGELHATEGDHRRALEAFRSAIELAPDDTSLRLREVREMVQAGDRNAAIEKLRSMIGADPPNLEAREQFVQLLREMGRLGEALGEARALSGLAADNERYRQLVVDLARETESSPPAVPNRPRVPG